MSNLINLSPSGNLEISLSWFFAALGLCLVIVMLFSKFVHFILVTFTKKKLVTAKKDFFVPLIGVTFIVALAILANNPFIYAIAMIIVATIITELEFLEKLMALLWNRPDYWKFQEFIVASKNAQQTTETPKGEKQLKDIEKKLETSGNNINAPVVNDWLLLYHFERVYRLIFGSQIGLLQYLASMSQGLAKDTIDALYKLNPISLNYPFESYIGFLVNNLMVQYDPLTNSYNITPIGRTFLGYLLQNQISTAKPN